MEVNFWESKRKRERERERESRKRRNKNTREDSLRAEHARVDSGCWSWAQSRHCAGIAVVWLCISSEVYRTLLIGPWHAQVVPLISSLIFALDSLDYLDGTFDSWTVVNSKPRVRQVIPAKNMLQNGDGNGVCHILPPCPRAHDTFQSTPFYPASLWCTRSFSWAFCLAQAYGVVQYVHFIGRRKLKWGLSTLPHSRFQRVWNPCPLAKSCFYKLKKRR